MVALGPSLSNSCRVVAGRSVKNCFSDLRSQLRSGLLRRCSGNLWYSLICHPMKVLYVCHRSILTLPASCCGSMYPSVSSSEKKWTRIHRWSK